MIMNSTKLLIEGSNIRKIVNIFKENIEIRNLKDKWYFYHDENLYIFGEERFYNRAMTNIVYFVIFKFEGKGKCKVEIVAGGGRDMHIGFGKFDPEDDQIRQIIKKLREVCDSNSWNLVEK